MTTQPRRASNTSMTAWRRTATNCHRCTSARVSSMTSRTLSLTTISWRSRHSRSMRRCRGERGGIFRDSEQAKAKAKQFRELEKNAYRACGLSLSGLRGASTTPHGERPTGIFAWCAARRCRRCSHHPRDRSRYRAGCHRRKERFPRAVFHRHFGNQSSAERAREVR